MPLLSSRGGDLQGIGLWCLRIGFAPRSRCWGFWLFDVKMQSAGELPGPINRSSNTVSPAELRGPPGQRACRTILSEPEVSLHRTVWPQHRDKDSRRHLKHASTSLHTHSHSNSLFGALTKQGTPQLGVCLSHRTELLRGRDYVINSKNLHWVSLATARYRMGSQKPCSSLSPAPRTEASTHTSGIR